MAVVILINFSLRLIALDLHGDDIHSLFGNPSGNIGRNADAVHEQFVFLSVWFAAANLKNMN